MKPKITKSDIRQQIEQDIDSFLQKGGEVLEVEKGESGLVNGYLSEQKVAFDQPKQERTPVSDVLKTIDARRSKKEPAKKTSTDTAPKKKIIYGDFGEPIRVVWE